MIWIVFLASILIAYFAAKFSVTFGLNAGPRDPERDDIRPHRMRIFLGSWERPLTRLTLEKVGLQAKVQQ